MKLWRGKFSARAFRWALFLVLASHVRDTRADVLYVSEFYQGRISKVDTSNGSVSPFVTGLNNPEGLGFDHAGNLYVAMQSQGVIDKISPSGAVTTFASGLNYYLGGLTLDASGNVYVGANRYAGTFVSAILKFNSSGTLLNTWTYNFAPTQPTGLAFDQGGTLWVSDYSGNGLYQVSPSGSATLFTSMYVNPMGVAVDAHGNVFVANRSSGTIAEVAAGGAITTFASGLDNPAGLAFDSAGNLYAANSPNGGTGTTLTRITPDGTSSIFASGLNEPVFIANQTMAVPEPQSFALLALATLLFRRRVPLAKGTLPE
jgi:sugar lactone lactonase YvrE